MTVNKFNIRVYGITINEQNQVLLADEFVLDTYMTKFPGGGLEFGEGTLECLYREAKEEFGQEIEITGHLYTTDYFQPTLFYKEMQLISIYYFFRFKEPVRFKTSVKPFDFPSAINGSISFRWADIETLDENEITFPIDKVVLKILQKKLRKH